MGRTLALICVLGTVVGAAVADEGPPVVPFTEARDHIGQECTVEMTVESSKNGVHRRTFFLDAMANYRDFKNLSVQISHDHLGAFQKAGIEDPAAYYKGKRLQVTGKVLLNLELNEVRILVNDPERIKVIKP